MRIELKLLRMRKTQLFSVMKARNADEIIIQSDKTIGMFNIHTGKGVLNTKGCYFPYLSKFSGAVDFDFAPYKDKILGAVSGSFTLI